MISPARSASYAHYGERAAIRTLRYALVMLPEDPPLELGGCALAWRVFPHLMDQLRRGRALADVLRRAIVCLRPPATLPVGDRRWWPYRICVMEYIEGHPRGEAEQILAISSSTYSRAKRRALERIAAILPELAAERSTEGMATQAGIKVRV